MKTRLLIIIGLGISSLFAVPIIHAEDCFYVTRHAPCIDSGYLDYLKHFDTEPPFTLAELTWSQGSYPITNGTGFATVILNEPDLNTIPNYKENVNVFVYSDSDPEIHVIELQETENDSGIFERQFGLSDSRSAPNVIFTQEGDTMGAMYVDTTMPPGYFEADANLFSTVLIGNRGPPLERVPASNVRIMDLGGDVVLNPVVGSQVTVLSDIVNQQNNTQKFVWFAQIVDDQRKTVSLAWIDGTLNSWNPLNPSVSWIPERVGKYTVTIFVWQSLENPSALSPPVDLEFSVIRESPSHGGPPIPFYDSELMLSFDSSIYHPVLGDGSPLMYKETGEPVLDETNCDRYAFWMTKHQKEKIDLYEDYPRYPPWGNQIFPLVDYCLENGGLKKIIAENKIYWSFYKTDGGVENEN